MGLADVSLLWSTIDYTGQLFLLVHSICCFLRTCVKKTGRGMYPCEAHSHEYSSNHRYCFHSFMDGCKLVWEVER